MKKFNVVLLITLLFTVGGLLTACGNHQKTANSEPQTVTVDSQQGKKYLDNMKQKKLVVEKPDNIEVANTSKNVKASSGIKFTAKHNTSARIYQFDNTDDAQKANIYYSGKKLQTHLKGRTLLVMGKTLNKKDFRNYQSAIFK